MRRLRGLDQVWCLWGTRDEPRGGLTAPFWEEDGRDERFLEEEGVKLGISGGKRERLAGFISGEREEKMKERLKKYETEMKMREQQLQQQQQQEEERS
ncbi:uncharacterized protein A4U43_C06F10680 [Asparagus officinalis]|uniref:Uncharacterized protein n=1 Tax=Asparagus officinalis TaxID=4686 RepID=A0A5P1EL00_ASPOF|nr:uncharacterized protein A4U43_C06F10680 [Asparagus officinalis]